MEPDHTYSKVLKNCIFLTTVSCLFFFACAISGIFAWGGWFDEFFSMYVTDPSKTLDSLWWNAWSVDQHPPFFNTATFALRRVFNLNNLVAIRLFNLLPVIITIFVALQIYSNYPPIRRIIIISAGLYFFSYRLFDYMHEFRSYATIMCLSYLLALQTIGWRSEISTRKFGGPWTYRFVLVIALLGNLHFTAMLFCGCLLLTVITDLFQRRGWFPVLRFATVGCLAVLPATLFLVFQYVAHNIPASFWVNTSFRDALGVIRDEFFAETGYNIIAYLFVVASLGKIFGMVRFGQQADESPALTSGCVILIVSVFLFLATLLLINMVKPIFIWRYLSPMSGPLCVIVAYVISRLNVRDDLILFCIAVGGAGSLISHLILSYHRDGERWEGLMPIILNNTKNCSNSQVIAGTDESDSVFANQIRITGYQYLSLKFGFKLYIPDRPNDFSIAHTAQCDPMILIEHFDPTRVDAWFQKYQASIGFNMQHTVFPDKSGALIVLSP